MSAFGALLGAGLLAWLLMTLGPGQVAAQSLEPRLYVPFPTGQNIVASTFSFSSGDVIFDASVPVTDVTAEVNSLGLAYVRAFGLFGRSAQVQAVTAYVDASLDGRVAGRDSSRQLNGLADPQLRFTVNLFGGPARTRAEFASATFKTIIGSSLILAMPLGKYEEDRAINIGANRWSVKPELGLVRVLNRHWAVEGYAGVWLFGHNTAYRDTSTAVQDPLWTFQAHLIRIFGRKAWTALDGTWVTGGTTKVDGVRTNSFQKSARFGMTGGWIVSPGHQIKASVASGVYTRLGGDFTVLSLGYNYVWGG